jgi:tetratricopeptide (TPR) repeat protein
LVGKKVMDQGLADLSAAVEMATDKNWPLIARGIAYRQCKDYARAIGDLDRATCLEPKNFAAFSHIAWIRATCPDSRYRDGQKAVSLATRACELAEWKSPFCLGCLAVACAEVGDFDGAVKWEKKAIELITNDDALRKKHTERLTRFQSKQPYREQADD